MVKDEFTEKYYEESNPHNKELFNPNKATVNRSSTKLLSTLSRSRMGNAVTSKSQLGQSQFYLPEEP